MAAPLEIAMVLPEDAPVGSGNRVSAGRWSAMLRAGGHRVRELEAPGQHADYAGLDLWIGLHAERSSSSLDLALTRAPGLRAITVLTGTDLNREGGPSESTQDQLDRSNRLVILNKSARRLVPEPLQDRVRYLPQVPTGIDPIPVRQAPTATLAMLGHLRPVKDPEVVLRALENLPRGLGLRVLHAGKPLCAELEQACLNASRNPSLPYQYLGPVDRTAALGILAESQGLLLPSRSEGGASVLSEALLTGRAVISSDAPGITSFLPDDYSGTFAIGDDRQLGERLERFATDAEWRHQLTELCASAGEQLRGFDEARGWLELVCELKSAR